MHSTTTGTVTHHFLVPRAQALAFAGQAAAQRQEGGAGAGGAGGASAAAGIDVGGVVESVVESVETRTGRDRERQGRSERARPGERGRESQRERQTVIHGAGRREPGRAAASITTTSRVQPIPNRANNTAPTPTNTPNASGGSSARVLRSTTRALASPGGQLQAEIEDTTVAMADSESSPHVGRRNAISSGSGAARAGVGSAGVGAVCVGPAGAARSEAARLEAAGSGVGSTGVAVRRPVNRGRAVPVVLPGKRKRGGTVGEWVRRVEEARAVGGAGEEEEEEEEEDESSEEDSDE